MNRSLLPHDRSLLHVIGLFCHMIFTHPFHYLLHARHVKRDPLMANETYHMAKETYHVANETYHAANEALTEECARVIRKNIQGKRDLLYDKRDLRYA